MLYNDEERRIMSTAVQPNMRSASISTGPFQRIATDFFQDRHFINRNILDIGPGQLDFLDIAKARGATRTHAIDFDPAIRQLGSLRGHDVTVADLKRGWPLVGRGSQEFSVAEASTAFGIRVPTCLLSFLIACSPQSNWMAGYGSRHGTSQRHLNKTRFL